MIRAGISTSSYLDPNGNIKTYDGIGQLTRLIIENMHSLSGDVEMLPLNFPTLTSLRNFQKSVKGQYVPAHFLFGYFSPFPLYRKLEQDIDLLHVTDFRVPKINVPVVNTVHDAFLVKYSDHSFKRRVANPIFQKGIDRSDKIIADCHAVISDLEKYWGINPAKVEVVSPGRDEFFDKRVTPKDIQVCRDKFGLKKPYLLFVSTLREYKNVNRLIDAYLSLKELHGDVDLVLVGRQTSDAGDRAMNMRVKKLHETRAIKWLSYVSKEELRSLYQGSIGVVFPTLDEGFGFPTIEALASKVPLLTSNYGAMKEVSGGHAILVDPYSVDSIREGIKKLVYDKALTAELVKKGWDHVQKFSWEKSAKQTLDVYKKVV